MRKLIRLAEYEVLRSDVLNNGTFDINGRFVYGDQDSGSFLIKGSTLQPITGDDMKILPDGTKKINVKKVYTETLLKTINEDDGTEPDRIQFDDGIYEVTNVEHWQGRRLRHYKVLLVKKEKQ